MLGTLLPLAATAVIGMLVGIVGALWWMTPPPSKMDLINQNMALGILARGALKKLDEEQEQELADDVEEKLKDAFGEENVGVEVGDVGP